MSGYFTKWVETNLPSIKGVPEVIWVPDKIKPVNNSNLPDEHKHTNDKIERVPCVPENEDAVTLEERIAIIQYDAGLPKKWAELFAKLDCIDCPLSITAKVWEDIKNNIGMLLDKQARE